MFLKSRGICFDGSAAQRPSSQASQPYLSDLVKADPDVKNSHKTLK